MFTDEEIVQGTEVTFRPSLKQIERFVTSLDVHGYLSGVVARPALLSSGWVLNLANRNTVVPRDAIMIVSGAPERAGSGARPSGHLWLSDNAPSDSNGESDTIRTWNAINCHVVTGQSLA